MKKNSLLLVLVFILFAFTERLPSVKEKFKLPQGVTSKDYLPNALIIKFKEGVRQDVMTQSTAHPLKLAGVSLSSLEPVFQENSGTTSQTLSGTADHLGMDRYYYAKYTGNTDIETVINRLLANDQVAYAEPHYIYTVWYTPNDAAYANQFYLPKVKAPEAWGILKNSSEVIIGIVDTGSELAHQDLAGNIYLNTSDPINGIDDDGDGYVDNYYGWDLCGATANAMVPDNDPNVKSKEADHGVHVSGIAGAVSDNAIGVASIAYNAKLLIVKAGPDDKPTSIYRGYEGIKYAADKGAHIINCSWGGTGGGQFGQDMVNYAIAKGCLVVAAAGNSANDVPIYPAAYEGVLAVANLQPNDQKGANSNYGSYVDISAPGEGIYNTVYNNSYAYYSGTSMAAPLVASAAALLKAKYPHYNGLQIGELIRATADEIDSQNPDYIHQLGKGRLNVYRALTETAYSVRYQNISVIDENGSNRAPGSEIALQFSLKNFLMPITALTLNISSNSPYVEVLNPQVNLGNFASLETKDIEQIKVKILPNAPDNHPVVFSFNYGANGGLYTDVEYFETTVAFDYLDVRVNKVSTTFSSNGRVGYSQASAQRGLGFVYKNQNMLYEASLMIAKSETQVSNNARFDDDSSEDFIKQTSAFQEQNSTATFEGKSVFTDAASALPIGVKVQSRILAFNELGNDKYVIVEYEITNETSEDLHNIYTGMFVDFDLDDSDANATQYNSEQKMAYVYARKKTTSYPYAGVKLLGHSAPPAYYPLSYQLPNGFLSDHIFTIAEKYKSLTSGIKSVGLGHDVSDGYDVMFTLGSGPYQLPAAGSIKVAYAFLAGDGMADLTLMADRAHITHQQITMGAIGGVPSAYLLKQNYPNAAKHYTYIPFDVPETAHINISLYDVTGKKVQEVFHKEVKKGSYHVYVNLGKLSPGVYFYKLESPKYKHSKKMIIAK